MNNKFNIIIILILICFLSFGCSKKNYSKSNINVTSSKIVNDEVRNEVKKVKNNNFVSYNGWLNIKENTLVNQYNEKIMLNGVSSHGIQWFPEFVNSSNIKTLKSWGSNVFRIALYTDEGGYLTNKNLKNKVYEMADLIINNDMYVIIDWHILHDNNPLTNLESSKGFFKEVSAKYKDTPNVIYEICNEPNGNTTWDDVYTYANEVIKVIRENSKNSIIIVGTPTWSQDIDKASLKPIPDNLVMYSLHFYSGTHKADLRNRLKSVIKKIPVFVSEFGVTDASGNGNINLEEAKIWLDLLEKNNISWINWSLTNKNEDSAFLKQNAGYTDLTDEYLSISGKFIKERLLNS